MDWFFSHDASDFAMEEAASAFENIYMPAVGVKDLDFAHRQDSYSIVEIDELLIAPGTSTETLKAYFSRFIETFDEDSGLPDALGYWCRPLSLTYDDEDLYEGLNQDSEYAYYVHRPAVLMINVAECGLTHVKAVGQNGKAISTLKRSSSKLRLLDGEALAMMVIEAVKDLQVDVVVYDSEM